MKHPHCGPDGFSPQAPAHMCEEPPPPPTHQVPEPDVFGLLLIGGLVAWAVKKFRQ